MAAQKEGLFSIFGNKKQNEEARPSETLNNNKAPEKTQREQESNMIIKGEWNRIVFNITDKRERAVQIWASTDKMQVKMCLLNPASFKEDNVLDNTQNDKQAVTAAEKKEYERRLTELEEKQKIIESGEFQPNNSQPQPELSQNQAAEPEPKPVQEEPPEPMDYEFLMGVLAKAKVIEGIIEPAIEQLSNQLYDKELIVAQGTFAVHGEDAVIHEFFSRDSSPKFETRADGSIDFKNMHLVTNVEKDTVISELIPPKPGIPGVNVFGDTVSPRNGVNLILQRGENTDIIQSEETPGVSNLVAKLAGNLVFKKDKFCVENVYKVDGDVSNSTGNINFLGNVIVSGDVLEGYEIRTPGSITVFGMVEGASLYAGENIHLEKGINGMSKGILQAGKEITAKFIENCNVRSGGDITSECIINSKTECDGNITVTGKGLISGGRLTVFGSISAKVLGSRSSTPLTIVLGITPGILRERNELDAQYKVVNAEYEEIRKNILYLEQQELSGEKAINREKIINMLNGRLSIATLKKQRFEHRREAIIEEMRNVATCTLSCDTAYPPARVTIGNATMIIKETYTNCRFYRNSDGEISAGMK